MNQFKTTDQYLRDQDKQVNIAIGASVDQINNYAKQIASLNDQISRLTGVGAGASPNDLLDQRDQLVSELNKVVGIEVSVQDGGTYNITMANGYSLVQGSSARQLAAVPSHADPSRVTVAYVDATAGEIEIPEKLLTSGTLGGMLTFRSQDWINRVILWGNWRWLLLMLSISSTVQGLMRLGRKVKTSLPLANLWF